VTRSWVEVDLDAIAANVATLAAVAPGSEVCVVVKADGYGHGATMVAGAALAAGATRLGVAHVAEGQRLRRDGIEAPIWVLAEPAADEWPEVAADRLEAAVYTPAGVDAAADAGAGTVHLKVDTGMHRVGARPDDVVDLARRIDKLAGLRLGSVWTHLAVADDDAVIRDDGTRSTDIQLDRYDEVLASLEEAGIAVPLRHAANSAGAIAHPRAHHDVVRCGIATYGLPPSPAMAGLVPLQAALSWQTAVALVKRVPAGATVGYGLRGRLDRPATLATLPVGYADGFRRGLWNTGGAVLIGGHRCPVIGVVSMDQTVVDCGDLDVAVGDEVVLIGRQDGAELTADDMARSLDTINYEITCGIGLRVSRRYLRSSGQTATGAPVGIRSTSSASLAWPGAGDSGVVPSRWRPGSRPGWPTTAAPTCCWSVAWSTSPTCWA
jgi:alanine racemase